LASGIQFVSLEPAFEFRNFCTANNNISRWWIYTGHPYNGDVEPEVDTCYYIAGGIIVLLNTLPDGNKQA
jgi:hypothetical protein